MEHLGGRDTPKRRWWLVHVEPRKRFSLNYAAVMPFQGSLVLESLIGWVLRRRKGPCEVPRQNPITQNRHHGADKACSFLVLSVPYRTRPVKDNLHRKTSLDNDQAAHEWVSLRRHIRPNQLPTRQTLPLSRVITEYIRPTRRPGSHDANVYLEPL